MLNFSPVNNSWTTFNSHSNRL